MGTSTKTPTTVARDEPDARPKSTAEVARRATYPVRYFSNILSFFFCTFFSEAIFYSFFILPYCSLYLRRDEAD